MSQEEKKKAKELKTSPNSRRNIISGLCLLLILIVIVIGAVGFWDIFSINRNMTASLSQLFRQIKSDQQQISVLQDKLTATEQQMQKQEEAFQKWRNILQKSGDYTQVLEAQYWVRCATDALLLSSDVPRALRLLNHAQEELAALTGPRILLLQKALGEDLATLKNASWVDSAKIYRDLIALQKQIENLPLALIPAQNKMMPLTSGATSDSAWERGWGNFKGALSQMVFVYHRPSEKVPPFVTPDEGPYLYQNIIAVLNGAMWAALYRDDNIYQASLQQAAFLVNQYFDLSAASTKMVLSQLSALQAVSLRPAKTLVLVSPKAFQDYLQLT